MDASVLANAIGDDGADGKRARAEIRASGELAAPDLVDVETVAVLTRERSTREMPGARAALSDWNIKNSYGFVRRLFQFVALGLALGAGTLFVGCASNARSAGVDAEERSFASNVNLRASDTPGFRTISGSSETTHGPLGSRVEGCDGGPIVKRAVHGVVSPLFQEQGYLMQAAASSVYRLRDASIAVRYIQAAVSNRGLSCIKRDALAKKPASSRLKVTEHALRLSLDGAVISGVRTVRVLPPITHAGAFDDRLWFAAGPFVVMLAFVAETSNPTTAQRSLSPIEHHLLALLYDRAQAHKP